MMNELETPDDDKESEDESVGNAMEKYLSNKVAEMAEHFDSVQVVATKHDGSDGATYWFAKGVGDSHARHGAMRRAIVVNEQYWKKG